MLASIHDPRYQLLQALLVRRRKNAGLTQSQMAELLRVGQSFVSKIERGEAYVDVFLFIDWCLACGEERPRNLLDALMEGRTSEGIRSTTLAKPPAKSDTN